MDLLTAFGLFAVTAMLVCYALEDRSGEVETPGNAEAPADLRAASKLLIQAAVLRRSVGERVPFDGDVAPFAFDVVVRGGAAKLLTVQGFRPIFLGNLHARCSNRGGSLQRSQSPADTKKCGDADITLSVVSGSTPGEAGLLLVNRNRTTSGGKRDPSTPKDQELVVPTPSTVTPFGMRPPAGGGLTLFSPMESVEMTPSNGLQDLLERVTPSFSRSLASRASPFEESAKPPLTVSSSSMLNSRVIWFPCFLGEVTALMPVGVMI
jgi:hypothetical protein